MLRPHFILLLIAASASFVLPGTRPSVQEQCEGPLRVDTLAAAYRQSLCSLSSPEFEKRKATRRILQQHGYGRMVYDVLTLDGARAALSYLRMKAQIEFKLPHHTLYVYATIPQREQPDWVRRLPRTSGAPSGPVPVALVDDWSFPADPWNVPR